MSRINLSTSSDIIDFFKILAEESVKQAKEEVSSQDPEQKRLERAMAKDSAVSAPLKKWFYGELDEPQRRALSAFAEALNDIMYRQQDTTVDPGDSPWNVAMSIKAKKDEEEEQSGEEEVEDITVSSATEKTPEESEEDTSPPIKVGEQQNISEIRQKVQELLRAD
jgi:hypothetical protein